MRSGPAALLLPAGLLLLASLLASHAQASHFGQGGFCADGVNCHWNLQPDEARSADVTIDGTTPDENLDEGDPGTLLNVRASTDPACGDCARALLRFPLEQLPPNATIRRVQLLLTQHASTTGNSAQRVITVWEVLDAWDEGTVNWRNQPRVGPVAINNHTTGLDPTSGEVQLGFGGTTQEVFQNACNVQRCPEPPERTGFSESIRRSYLGLQPYYGHELRDRDTVVGPLPEQQQYDSSADQNLDLRRPMLVVHYDPNAPVIRDLAVDGRQFVNATSTRPVNLSFEVFDRAGHVLRAFINATTEDGHEVFNRSVLQNETVRVFNEPHHFVWSNTSLGLPCDDLNGCNFVVNAFALDDDGNLNFTQYRQVNLTVENQPPFVNDTSVSASDLDEGQSFAASARAEDRSGIDDVRLQVERSGEVLANVSFRPDPDHVNANMSGDWRLTHTADWAGNLNLTVWVVDRAGNANHSLAFHLHVRDVFPPAFHDARVLAPGTQDGTPMQEAGGVVRWEARVTDASPLTVTLFLTPPGGGAEQSHAMGKDAEGVWRFASNFSATGIYGGRIVARDLDGNPAERSGLGFVMTEPAPPLIASLSPQPDTFAQGQASLSAVVSDLNLDPGSITMETRVPPAAFTPAASHTVSVAETARRVEATDRFFHGEAVEVRVRAADLFGRQAEQAWRFTVDARDPLTILTPEGTFLAGNRTAITGTTSLRIERTDEGSGVLATVFALVNEDRHVESGNNTVTGGGDFNLTLRNSPVYAGTGNYTVFYGSVDRAGNVEPVQRRRLLVDDSAPVVNVTFEPGLLSARVRELGAGLRQVRAFYWLTPGGQQGSTLMSPTADPEVWQGQIPDAERGAQVLYAVEATDLLGNVGRAGSAAQPLSSIVQNHRPVIALTPPNGSLVRGTVDIAWTVADKDGDTVQVSVAVKPSTSSEARQLAPLRGAQGSIAWDTGSVGDGLWEVLLTARDSFDTVRASSFVEVTNTDSKIVRIDRNAPEPGQPLKVEVTLYKPVRRAEAVLRLDGQEVGRAQLRDDGGPPDRKAADGVFTGQLVPGREGDYKMDLEVLFDDGKLEVRQDIAVAVQYAYPGRIVHDPLLLALAIGVPAVLAGAFLWRRYGPIGPRARKPGKPRTRLVLRKAR
jgi:hypothetical protein